MLKKLLLITFLFLFVLIPKKISAQQEFSGDFYAITDFSSVIEVQKDTTLLITETISVNFPDYRHGIYRVIPITYSVRGKTLNSRLKVLRITDGEGKSVHYEKSRRGQSVSLKIGDPDITLTGLQTYVITYTVDRVIQRYETHDEVYWNITGSEWDTDILKASAVVRSSFAEIKRSECFGGPIGTTSKECRAESSEKESSFSATTQLGYGQDFTVVVALDKNSELIFPGRFETLLLISADNWGYPISLIPFGIMIYFWFKKGRDKRFLADTVYYKPKDAKETTVSPFARKFLPMVYHPIDGFTPSQIGTIVDEKVDIHDIVAEIVELARLGFLRIEKIEKDKLIGKETDYAIYKLEKDVAKLNEYQLYLLDKLFDKDYTSASIKGIEQLFKDNDRRLKDLLKLTTNENIVLISSLKNKFYAHLEEFRKELYKSLGNEKIFDGKVDQVRGKWIAIFVGLDAVVAILLFNFVNITANFFPLIIFGLLSVPSFFFAYAMPRKTAWGYSLYQQIRGLAYYLKKGKWRHEIAEKHLFFEEMIPLAISLEVIDKLAKDMQDLGVKPPSYFAGTATGTLYSDLSTFESRASTNLVSAPGGKGSSSWSGGSGFSGGGSGGGFGGGGGGSW